MAPLARSRDHLWSRSEVTAAPASRVRGRLPPQTPLRPAGHRATAFARSVPMELPSGGFAFSARPFMVARFMGARSGGRLTVARLMGARSLATPPPLAPLTIGRPYHPNTAGALTTQPPPPGPPAAAPASPSACRANP